MDEIIVLSEDIENPETSITRNEVLKLFVNKNTKITHLYIPLRFNYQIHLIPGAECCFSQLKFIDCLPGNANLNILEGLSKISKSIEKLRVLKLHNYSGNCGMVNLIEAQKNLNDVSYFRFRLIQNESVCRTLENSLIKHMNTIQHLRIEWLPVTRILSYLVNLISLTIEGPRHTRNIDWNHLENVSLPSLKILKARYVSTKSLASLIENIKGQLTEVSIDYGVDDNKNISKQFIKVVQNLNTLSCHSKIIFFQNLKSY